MLITKSKLLVVACLFALSGGEIAAQKPPSMTAEERAATFDKSDANKDGKLSTAEFKASLPSEAQAQADGQLEQMFARRDSNGDGYISKGEYGLSNINLCDVVPRPAPPRCPPVRPDN